MVFNPILALLNIMGGPNSQAVLVSMASIFDEQQTYPSVSSLMQTQRGTLLNSRMSLPSKWLSAEERAVDFVLMRNRDFVVSL